MTFNYPVFAGFTVGTRGAPTLTMASASDVLAAVFTTPPDDDPPCVAQANSFREVVSLLYWWRQLPGQ